MAITVVECLVDLLYYVNRKPRLSDKKKKNLKEISVPNAARLAFRCMELKGSTQPLL